MNKLHQAIAEYTAAVAAEREAEAAFSAACDAASAQAGGDFYAHAGVGALWTPPNDEKQAAPLFFEECSVMHGRCPARVVKAAEDHGLVAAFELMEETKYVSYAAERALLAVHGTSRAEEIQKFAALACTAEDGSDLLRGDLVDKAWAAIEAALRSADDTEGAHDADKAVSQPEAARPTLEAALAH